MNSLLIIGPAECDAGFIGRTVTACMAGRGRSGDGWAEADQERIYWNGDPDLHCEYGEEQWSAIQEIAVDTSAKWVFDYSGGFVLVQDVVAAIAKIIPTVVVDNDVDPPMTGREFVSMCESVEAWNWWEEHLVRRMHGQEE